MGGSGRLCRHMEPRNPARSEASPGSRRDTLWTKSAVGVRRPGRPARPRAQPGPAVSGARGNGHGRDAGDLSVAAHRFGGLRPSGKMGIGRDGRNRPRPRPAARGGSSRVWTWPLLRQPVDSQVQEAISDNLMSVDDPARRHGKQPVPLLLVRGQSCRVVRRKVAYGSPRTTTRYILHACRTLP